MLHEEDITRVLFKCVILHNICTGKDLTNENLIPQDEEGNSGEVTAETLAGKSNGMF